MVDRLMRGPASLSELAEPLDMTLSAVGQHLKVLERSGLVTSRKVGRIRTCQLEAAELKRAERWIADRRARWESRLDKLGTLLTEEKPC